MAIGTLTAYTLPAWNIKLWDHTYVASSAGLAWGCHGRALGGTKLCDGPGNIDQAACLAQANGEAGVSQWVTGVCHQMANRILYPAQLDVMAARGYALSTLWWGSYGLDSQTRQQCHPILNPWPELVTCQTQHAHP
jgi:hypothetical protein